MARPDEPRPSKVPDEAAPRRRPIWATGMICLSILPLIGFIGQRGRTLWAEWAALGGDRASARTSAVVGYPGISPNPTFATRPRVWKRDENDQTLVWSGWSGRENLWFAFAKGELDEVNLSFPLGRDTVQAIDRPIYRPGGDEFWARVPDDAKVVPLDLGTTPTACPLLVLDKVEVINELAGGRPVLIAFSPGRAEIAVYDATLDGERVTMGHSGFFDDYRPVLYDRGTESFWIGRDGGEMAAVAGRRKGSKLRRIARLEPVAWGDWKARNPAGRLLVGATRIADAPPD